MMARALSYPCGMEVCALEHHVGGCIVCAAALASEDAGYTHGFLGIADAQVVESQGVLLTVEGDELGALGLGAHHNLVARHLVGVEAVHRLAVSHHDVVGDIHNIINRTQADDLQLVLKPFGTLLHLASRHAQAGIALAGLGVLDGHLYRHVVVIHRELAAVGSVQACLLAVGYEPCVEVARHAPVRQCVGTVGGDVHLYQPVALQVIVFSGRSTHLSVLGQHDDTGMVGADANLVLCANHAAALHATQFRLLDNKFLVAVVEHAAQVGNNHLLSRSHVGRATDNL